MTRAVAIVRNILWTEGVLFCLGVPQVVLHLANSPDSYRWSDRHFLALVTLIYGGLGYTFLTGLAALTAAYGLENNRKWGPTALRVVSILNLAVVPFGTPLGTLGLWMTSNPRARAELANEVFLRGAGGLASPKRIAAPWTWTGRLAVVAQFALGAVMMAGLVEWLKQRGTAAPGYAGFVGNLCAGVLLGILFHELGHVVAGKLAGLRFRTLSAGPVVASRMSDEWRAQWVNSMGLFNGMTVMAPSGPRKLRAKAMVFLIGGPLGSLTSGAVALKLMMLAATRWHWGGSAELLGVIGAIGLVNGFANLIPFRVAGGYSDGARLLQLVRRQPEGIRFLAELAFGLSDTTTLRPKDWHPQWISAVTEEETSPGFSRGCYRAYVYHLDRGETDDAGVWLARCVDSHRALRRDPYRSILAMENAFFEARHLKNPEAAREWLSVPQVGVPAERFTVLRVQAAIYAAEGERELAGQAIGEAVRLHATTEGTGFDQFERAVLRDVQNWLDDLAGASSLSRLAQAVRERDSLIKVSKAMEEPQPSRIRRLLRNDE